MKSTITIITALLIMSFVSFSIADSDTTSTSSTSTTVEEVDEDIVASSSSKSRGIIPQDKTNWSKIKDIFM